MTKTINLLFISIFVMMLGQDAFASCCSDDGNSHHKPSLISSEISLVCQFTEKKCREKGKTGAAISTCTAAIAHSSAFNCYVNVKGAKGLNSSTAKEAAAEYCAGKAWRKCKNGGGCSISCN